MIFITHCKFNETLFYGRDYSELARKFENSSKLCFLIFTPVRFCCNSLQLLGRNQRQSLKLTWDLIIATFINENCSNFPIIISESFNFSGGVNPPVGLMVVLPIKLQNCQKLVYHQRSLL